MTTPLRELDVLALDCQATSPNPATGHLLEIGWSDVRAREPVTGVESRLVQLPAGAEIPRRVRRVTGLSEEALAGGSSPEDLWPSVVATAKNIAARTGSDTCTTIIHFSRYESAYLRWLNGLVDDPFPLSVVCTHAIVERLLPSLPRRGLRAVAGYFGHAVSEMRRASDHVAATVAVWKASIHLLESEASVRTLEELDEWLRSSRPERWRARADPMLDAKRRALPDRPGVYRMHGGAGNVLYVGKAASLRQRVASYFQKSASHPEHILEMLTQARDVETTVTRSAVEAALEEADAIKRIAPPYNKALRARDRTILHATPRLDDLSDRADQEHRFGPLPASELWRALALCLAANEPLSPAEATATSASFAPGEAVFHEGLDTFRRELGETSVLARGAALWLEETDGEEPFRLRAQHDVGAERWTSAGVAKRLNEIVRRTTHMIRRGHWLCLLSESAITWNDDPSGARLGLIVEGASVRPLTSATATSRRFRKSFVERRRGFDLDAYDRMIVLTKEIRRLVSEERGVRLRVGRSAVVTHERLRAMLRWI